MTSVAAIKRAAMVNGLIVSVPERYTGSLTADMHCFTLPVPTSDVTISLLWHARCLRRAKC